MTDLRLAYVTASNADDAERIGRALVQGRFAACANVLPTMTSIYRWEDAIETAKEAVLIAKTTADRAPALIKEIERLHDYDTPCVLILPVEETASAFGAWLRAET